MNAKGKILAVTGAATISAAAMLAWQQQKDDYQDQALEAMRDQTGTIELPADFDEKYFKDVIIGRIRLAANGNCAERQAAWTEAADFFRAAQVISEQDVDAALAPYGHGGFVEDTRIQCIEEAYYKCAVQHDLAQANVLMGYARTPALIMESDADELAMTRAAQCLSFELDITAEADYALWTPRAAAEIPLRVTVGEVSGAAHVRVDARVAPYDGDCRKVVRHVSGPEQMRVRKFKHEQEDDLDQWNPEITFELNPSVVKLMVQTVCDGDDPAPIHDASGLYSGAFINMIDGRKQEADGYWYPFKFARGETGGERLKRQGVAAYKRIEKTKDDVTLRIEFTLRHVPPWPVETGVAGPAS